MRTDTKKVGDMTKKLCVICGNEGKVRAQTSDYPKEPPTNVRLCDACWAELKDKQGETVRLEKEDGKDC